MLKSRCFWSRRDPIRAATTWAAALVILTGLSVVGLQVLADQRFAHKTMQSVAIIDQDLDALRTEISELQSMITDNPEREENQKAIDVLETRVLLREVTPSRSAASGSNKPQSTRS